MFRNIYYDRYKSEINLWSTVNGVRQFEKIPWVPYVFKKHNSETGIKTINGENVIRKTFPSYFKYKELQDDIKKNKGYDNIFEDRANPEIQYLAERYHHIEDEDIVAPELKVFTIDIEVHSDDGVFPDPASADYPITAITICDNTANKFYTFGLFEYETEILQDEDIEYRYFPLEEDLLVEFIEFIRNEHPDVITGWNIVSNKKMMTRGFDLPYIVNRSKKVIDRKFYKRLSPVDRVRVWESDGYMTIDIEGISLVDYMALYKWYSPKNPESYSLNFISNLELGKGKVDYQDYGSLKNLYYDNWNLYIDYNIVDTKRIKELEDKLGYINLIQSFSLITKCPMKHFTSMITMLEGRMLVHYRKNNLCAPRMKDSARENYPAAYVKTPVPGLYKWIFSIDIKSSYPTAIITLNMSVETYIGRIMNFTEDQIIEYTSKREFPPFSMDNYNTGVKKEFKGKSLDKFNLMLKRGLICIAPWGVCFKTRPEGVVTYVEREMFEKRQQIKNLMKNTKDANLKKQYDTFQLGLKILINSFYGILAYPHGNRYTNPHIAAAITSCGRHAVKQGEKISNNLLNNPNNELKNILNDIQKKCEVNI